MRLMICLAACALAAAAQDAREIVSRAVEFDRETWERVRNYTFLERREERSLDKHGRVKSREITTWDVTLLEGSPYQRLIERDDKPLAPDEERKQQEKLRKSIEERLKETPQQRAKRLAKWEEERRKQREALREIPEAFDLSLLGEERIDGRDVYVIEATPRAGYKPSMRSARFFPKMRGKLWIDKRDHGWAKAEVELTDTISLGLFLARVHKGTRLTFEQTRVNGEVWLPRRVDVSASGRIAALVRLRREIEVTYRNYRKFQSDSRVVAVGEQPEER